MASSSSGCTNYFGQFLSSEDDYGCMGNQYLCCLPPSSARVCLEPSEEDSRAINDVMVGNEHQNELMEGPDLLGVHESEEAACWTDLGRSVKPNLSTCSDLPVSFVSLQVDGSIGNTVQDEVSRIPSMVSLVPQKLEDGVATMASKGADGLLAEENLEREPSGYNILDYSNELKGGVAVALPAMSSNGVLGKTNDVGCCLPCSCCTPCLEHLIAITPEEALAHRQLSLLTSIPLDEHNPDHRRAMEQYWHLMLGDDVPYEDRSDRWSDDLGFQSKNPWSDFRGGGLLALRCLLYMADKHNPLALVLADEAQYSKSHAWYPFSPAGISVCQLLAVHLNLHARPSVGPVRTLPGAHALALKRFAYSIVCDDPVEVFASYWLTAFHKLHREWRDLCDRDPRANVLVNFNQVYRSVGVAVERALGTRRKDRLGLLADVDAQSKVTLAQNRISRSNSAVLVNLLKAERRCRCRTSRTSRMKKQTDAVVQGITPEDEKCIRPPEKINSAEIYKLYRGAIGSVEGDIIGRFRIWADFPQLQLSLACSDQPATHTMSLLDITQCRCEAIVRPEATDYKVDVYSSKNGIGAIPDGPMKPAMSITGSSLELKEFAELLQQLVDSRDQEGKGVLLFIQRRLFQYLWRSNQLSCSQDRLYEAEAVLAFNIDPKDGIAYLKSMLNKTTDEEIGAWLWKACSEKGGLDPTMLGAYFSRKDTLEVFRAFVTRMNFGGSDILGALRLFFATFKPAGEGQVIDRLLEYFSESYFLQWQRQEKTQPQTAYREAGSVLIVAYSLIMLNTGLHVATKRIGKPAPGAAMTPDEYVVNTRRSVLTPEEVPDDTLRFWHKEVAKEEIAVEPMPRVAFSKLPVQPDMEGWLIAVIDGQVQRRYWAVLALRRMYLFTDTNGDVDPADAIDLKNLTVQAVEDDPVASKIFRKELGGNTQYIRPPFIRSLFRPTVRSEFAEGLLEAEYRALEISQKRATDKPSILEKSESKPRSRLAFVAESRDLMQKWVILIGQ